MCFSPLIEPMKISLELRPQIDTDLKNPVRNGTKLNALSYLENKWFSSEQCNLTGRDFDAPCNATTFFFDRQDIKIRSAE